jgi:transglutaminase-like putative cysteine protease
MQMKLPSLVFFPLCAAIACGRSGQAGWSAADESLQRFAVSIQGEDIGYMQIEIDRMDGDSVRLHEETVWDLVLMGTSRHVVMELDATADSTLNLSRLDFHLTDGSAEISSTTIRDGQEVITTIHSAGRDIEISSAFEGDFIPVVADLACALMPWEPGQERSFPTFDPAAGSVSEAVATCVGFEPEVLLGDTVESTHLLIRAMGTTTDVWVWNRQIVRELDSGLSMEMTRVPPGQGGDVSSNRDLYEVFAVSSTPVIDPRLPGTRRFVLEGEIDWSAFQLDYPPVQVADGDTVTVSTMPPPGSPPFPMEADSGFARWLADEPMIQVEDPSISKTADSVTAGSTDAWQAACALCRFVDVAVENTPTVSLPSSVEVLESRRGDCNEHTVLFVALARAAGIPCRTCAGIVYLGESFGYHAWPMVWVGQWVPMDPTFGQMVADPTHIILAEGNLESQYVITSVMGRLRVTEVPAGTR